MSSLLARAAERQSAAMRSQCVAGLRHSVSSTPLFRHITQSIQSRHALVQQIPNSSGVSSRRFASTTSEPLSPPPRKRFQKLKWAWRLTYLSAIGSLAYVGYGIYLSRMPTTQLEFDPSKKTLVVLGTGWGSVSLLKKLDTENYNVIVISPRNYFLFTPLLPSCTVGTVEHRSIMEPVRNFLRHKKTKVQFYEAHATKVDYERRVVLIKDESEIKGDVSATEVPFDLLVVGVGEFTSCPSN